MIETVVYLSAAAMVAYAADVATRFSRTSHGANPWTTESFANALVIAPRVSKVMKLIGGTLNDAYRCPKVNAAVGGVGNSYHQLGLAADIKPGAGFTPESAARLVFAHAKAGNFGLARTVIWEPTWVHIDFHNPKDVGPPSPCRFFKKLPNGKYEPVT